MAKQKPLSLAERAKQAEIKKEEARREQNAREMANRQAELAAAKENVPAFVTEIIKELEPLADAGHREHEISIFDGNERYCVVKEIAERLRASRTNPLTVEVDEYHSPGSYGDQGEEFVRSSHRYILKISW